jgi:hypothetical protein
MTHRALLEHTEIHWSPPSMIGLTRLYVLMVELERREVHLPPVPPARQHLPPERDRYPMPAGHSGAHHSFQAMTPVAIPTI